MEFNETAAKAKMREIALKSRALLDGSFDGTAAEAAAALDKLKADADRASAVIANIEKARSLGALATTDEAPAVREAAPRSIGEAVIKSAAYGEAKGRVGSASSFHASFETKANELEGTLGTAAPYTTDVQSGNAGAVVTPNFLPGIVDIRQRPLVVADLFAQGTTDSPIIVYVQETARTNAAAAIAEGSGPISPSTKPQSDTTLARVNEPVVKIAHYVTVSDEMMEDSSALMAFLNSQLVQGVRLREQQQLLNGTGTLPQLQGVLLRTGLQTPVEVADPTGTQGLGLTAGNAIAWMDAIHTQISNIRWNAFCEPDAILVNPSDWNTLRLAKDANNQYMGGGPFTAAYGNGPYTNVQSLWGFRVVVTPEIAAGTVLVGAFAEAGQIFRRSGIRVEMTNSDGTDFINNLVKIRAEERLGLAIYRPGCFGTVVNLVETA